MQRLTIIDSSIGKIETSLTVEEAVIEVERAKKENDLAKFPTLRGTATINIDWTHTTVLNDRTRFIDLSEVRVFGYDDNTYSPMPEEADKKAK